MLYFFTPIVKRFDSNKQLIGHKIQKFDINCKTVPPGGAKSKNPILTAKLYPPGAQNPKIRY
jgi:hypothetical protein